MTIANRFARNLYLLAASAVLWLSPSASGQSTTTLPSESPAQVKPVTDTFDYSRRDVMIPMRDGVKLHTVILIPKGAKNAPILLTRTPYNASDLTTHANSSHLGPILEGYDNATDVIVEGGYIRVIQDVRGKYGSEGDYVMNRPLHGPLNPTTVDHATDTYDTIDWLVKNLSESNGKVGILGISYDGFTPLMALVNPHPALKVSVPMNPMVDGWMGDDWFHNGAFREQNMPYIYEQDGTRDNSAKWWTDHFDDYDVYMQAGSAGELGRRHGLEQMGFWRKILEHPSYDSFWQQQAMDKILAAQPLKVPIMLVHSLWDQEDIYGATAVYKALKPKDTNNDKVFLVMGPWHHGQEIEDAYSLGAIKFGSDTGTYFRQHILAPFLAQYLKDDAPKARHRARLRLRDRHQRLARPPRVARKLFERLRVEIHAALSQRRPKTQHERARFFRRAFDEYISDPSKPVPYPRPPQSTHGLHHRTHLVAMARRRPARSFGPPRRPGLHFRRSDQRP